MATAWHADTSLIELGLTGPAISRLGEMGVARLADFSEVTEREMTKSPRIGTVSVTRVREALVAIGMDFKEDPNPQARAGDRNRASLKRAPQPYGPDTLLEDVGISTGLFWRCWRAGLRTPSDLSKLSARDVYGRFGKAQGKEIIAIVAKAGISLEQNPTASHPLEVRLRRSR